MKILFLHGMFGQRSSKPDYIKSLGHNVYSPILDDWNFLKSVEVAQRTFEEIQPHLVIGSSRGGAVAMNIDSKKVPLILLAPAWPFFGNAKITKKNSTIIHSENDKLISINYSIKLSKNSCCEIIVAGEDHRLNCQEGKKALISSIKNFSNN
jgi:hypothetical protein